MSTRNIADDSMIDRSIYTPLDPRSRQIRVLKLHHDSGNSMIYAELIVTSIPPPTLVIDPLAEYEGSIPKIESRIQTLLDIKKALEIEKASLQTANSSLEPNRGQTPELSSETQKIRHYGLGKETEDLQQSADQVMQRMSNEDPDGASIREVETSSEEISDVHSGITAAAEMQQDRIKMIEYEAISYCWNSVQSKTTILLNGTPFDAPSSAVTVLRNLRLANHDRILWIDALCINQTNLNEREQQIAMMGDIYTNSMQTVIWLGPSIDDAKTVAAFELCSVIARQLLQGRAIDQLTDLNAVAEDCEGVVPPEYHPLSLLDVIFTHSWFTRVWVWQEVALPSVCVCHIGEFTAPWPDIMLTSFWWIEMQGQYDDAHSGGLPSDTAESNMHFPSTIFMNGVNFGNEEVYSGPSLSELVTQSRHCRATEPRDKVFALLGMTRWSRTGLALPLGITPDYKQSVRDCMRNASRVMLEEDGNLYILSDELLEIKQGAGSGYDAWPSWTPVWSVVDDIQQPVALGIAGYCADDGRTLNVDRIRRSEDADALLLDGYQVDLVERAFFIPKHFFADIASAGTDIQRLSEFANEQIHVPLEKILLTLLADKLHDKRINEDNEVIDVFLRYLKSTTKPSTNSPGKKSEDIADDTMTESSALIEVETIRADLRNKTVGRQFFITNNRRVGIGPGSISIHDTIAVLFGGPWPFILRQQGQHYTLVGHSFVRGLMDGEGVRDCKDEDLPAMTFEVR